MSFIQIQGARSASEFVPAMYSRRHYGGGKHSSAKHHGHGHRYYRSGHGYGYWRGGVWITTGFIGYGAGSYCSRLYYYDYGRWLYECQ